MKTQHITLKADQPLLPASKLTAGHLSMLYEEGRLRYIRYKGKEVLRMIYPALRDEHWNSVMPDIREETVTETEDGFAIRYSASFRAPGIAYTADIEIRGSANEEIVFTMRGEALSDFLSKRVGLCVHHPIDPCSGREIELIRPDGSSNSSRFPNLVSPHTPFTDVQGMRWTSSDGISARIDLEGDVFETEDQRNWGDDSFKTYSGPQYYVSLLDLKRGDRMQHTVTFRIEGEDPQHQPAAPHTGAARADERAGTERVAFPLIGYCRAAQGTPLSDREIALAGALPFDHYRVELHLGSEQWAQTLSDAAAEAAKMQVSLELVVFFQQLTGAEIDACLRAVGRLARQVSSVLILSENHSVAPVDFYTEAHRAFKKTLPGSRIGYGTDSWFAELSTQFPEGVRYDFLSFHLNPQAHQRDTRSIIENLGSHRTLIQTLHTVSDGADIHVSPLSFDNRPRAGADGLRPDGEADPRLHSELGAWWTVNALQNLAGAARITLGELTGNRGLIRPEGSPVYDLLKTLKEFAPLYVVSTPRPHDLVNPEANDGLTVGFENASGDRLLVTWKTSAFHSR